MGPWQDSFGRGSRFRAVFWRTPPLVAALWMAGLLAATTSLAAGDLQVLLLVMPALVVGVLSYPLLALPAMAAWFTAFRLGRRAGLTRRGAALAAAPVTAAAAALVLGAVATVAPPVAGLLFIHGLTLMTWLLAALAAIVALVVAATAGDGTPRPAKPDQAFEW